MIKSITVFSESASKCNTRNYIYVSYSNQIYPLRNEFNYNKEYAYVYDE